MSNSTDALDLDAWKASLTRWTNGLDLDDDLDRYVFQKRVQVGTAATRSTLLNQVYRALTNGDHLPFTREDLVRGIADAWISHSTRKATTPVRPAVAVGGRYGVDQDTRAMVAAELCACADELEIQGAQRAHGGMFDGYMIAVAYLRDRADTIKRGDDR